MQRPLPFYLLEWLAKEETSSYGECMGADLDHLMEEGLAEFAETAPPGLTIGYARVRLTRHGITWVWLIRADRLVETLGRNIGGIAPGSHHSLYEDYNNHTLAMQSFKPKPKTDGA